MEKNYYEKLMDKYLDKLALYVKFEKDTEEVANYVTELVLSNKISLKQAVNFPKMLLAQLLAISEILGRDLESDLKQVREAYEKCVKKD